MYIYIYICTYICIVTHYIIILYLVCGLAAPRRVDAPRGVLPASVNKTLFLGEPLPILDILDQANALDILRRIRSALSLNTTILLYQPNLLDSLEPPHKNAAAETAIQPLTWYFES